MEGHASSTLEMIKLQEQENEAKLKEKREQEAVESCLNKAIRDATIQAEKSEKEVEKLTKSIELLTKQKMLVECRRQAFSAQLDSLKQELNTLRLTSEVKNSKVWDKRSSFCKEIYSISEAYDIWTLLMKPSGAESVPRNTQKKSDMPINLDNERRLQVALDRRIKALAERDRLYAEPDNGEEFVKLKNALRYCLEKIENLKSESYF